MNLNIELSLREIKGLAYLGNANAVDILEDVRIAEHRLRNNLDRMNLIEFIRGINEEQASNYLKMLLSDTMELLNHPEVNEIYLKQCFESKQSLISIKDRCEFLIKYKDYEVYDKMFETYMDNMDAYMKQLLTELNEFF